MARTVTVRTPIDAWVDASSPNTEHPKAKRLSIRGVDNIKYAFLRFQLPFRVGEAVVSSAILRLYVDSGWSGTHTVSVRRVIETWKESTVNYTNRPDVDTDDLRKGTETVTSPAAKTAIEVDIVNLIADAAAGGDYFGVRVEVDTTGTKKLYSAEATGYDPELEITYSVAPLAPDNLHPDGDQAVGDPAPTLTWNFEDVGGDASQSALQVQVNTTSSFTSPAFDSGEVASVEQQLDLGDTAFTPLTDGQSRWWRVRVKDEDGNWSAWSDPVQFTYKALGTLTLTNPAADPNDFVEETTPPISWTFTPPSGESQESYHVQIFEDDDQTPPQKKLVWDSGRVVSTASSQEVPAETAIAGSPYTRPVIRDEAKEYRVDLTVWDTVDRQGGVGDPPYVKVTRTFTYVRSGDPAPVTSLTATTDGSPVIDLEWERATQPDYFALKDNDVIVKPRIDPTEVFVSGTTYSMLYSGAIPNESHTLEVEAVVDDAGVLEHSDGNDTAVVDLTLKGVWLVRTSDGLKVPFFGEPGATMRIGESGTTYFPIGRRDPVRIIDSLRGYEGEVQAYIRTYAGVSAKTYRDRLEEIRGGGNHEEVMLMLKDYAFPVDIADVEINPVIENEELFKVKFAFWQKDAFTFEVPV